MARRSAARLDCDKAGGSSGADCAEEEEEEEEGSTASADLVTLRDGVASGTVVEVEEEEEDVDEVAPVAACTVGWRELRRATSDAWTCGAVLMGAASTR